MQINEKIENELKEHFGYNDEELKIFLKNPRNREVISKTSELLNKTIIFKVIESQGCNSHHKVGDKFYFDGAGNLLTKFCPKKVCIYALSEIDKLIFAENELIYANVEPNNMRFKRSGCFDIGLKCGGWGKIIMEMRVVERIDKNEGI
jgi:uncharacterized repeat protein (TIGR04076 family)